MKDSLLVPIDLVEDVRATLQALHIYCDAQDLADSQRRMRGNTTSSNLTIEVRDTLAAVEDLYSRHLLAERDARRESAPVKDEEEYFVCDDDDHEFDTEGYCIYCGAQEGEVDDGQTVDDAPDAEQDE